jgi:hypothetical protein
MKANETISDNTIAHTHSPQLSRGTGLGKTSFISGVPCIKPGTAAGITFYASDQATFAFAAIVITENRGAADHLLLCARAT